MSSKYYGYLPKILKDDKALQNRIHMLTISTDTDDCKYSPWSSI